MLAEYLEDKNIIIIYIVLYVYIECMYIELYIVYIESQ